MKLESVGLLIGMRPFGERDSVAQIFTREFGVLRGMMKGAAVAKKNKPLVGQIGAVAWNARLDSQLGAFHWEAERNIAAPLMTSAARLGVMNSVFALIATLLPEREAYSALYDNTRQLLLDLGAAPSADAVRDLYLDWEIGLLDQIGYALDLTSCSNCKCTDHLNYLSPRTGRAVCDDCAAPYVTKLFRLPMTLDVARQFLANICTQQGVALPPARLALNL